MGPIKYMYDFVLNIDPLFCFKPGDFPKNTFGHNACIPTLFYVLFIVKYRCYLEHKGPRALHSNVLLVTGHEVT